MCMDKKKINEEAVPFWYQISGAIFSVGIYFLIQYLQGAAHNWFSKIVKPKKSGDCSDEVLEILMDSDVFIKDLAKVVMKQGGFTKFVDKMKADYDGQVFNWSDFDDAGFIKTFGRQRTDVVKELLKSKAVKDALRDVNCENEKDTLKRVGNNIFQWITHPNFGNTLKNALEAIGEKVEDKVNEQQKIKLKSLLPKK